TKRHLGHWIAVVLFLLTSFLPLTVRGTLMGVCFESGVFCDDMIDAPAPSASPTLPPLNLLYNAQLPDPFTMYNGFKVTTQCQWQSRRAELKEAFFYYMYGHMPPSSPVSVVGIDPDVLMGVMLKDGASQDRSWRSFAFQHKLVHSRRR